MIVSTDIKYSVADKNLARLWRSLLQDEHIPSIADFTPLDGWHDKAIEMIGERKKDGTPGGPYLKAVYSSVTNIKKKTPDDTRFIAVISGLTPDTVPHVKPEPVGTLLSDVRAEKINWLWEGRLALGKLSIWDGDPGIGKSLATLDIAAKVTRGYVMPDKQPCLTPGGVVLITPEDGLADTIQPRLARVAADLKNIVSISTIPTVDKTGREYQRAFTLPDDLPILEQAIDRVKAKLVIIDPIMSVMGCDKDTYKDNEVRSILGPLGAMAEEKEVAVIMVRHWSKGGGSNAKYKGLGSIGFIGISRTAFMFMEDPEDPSRAIFANTKNNIYSMKSVPTLLYSIVNDKETSGDERPYVDWQGESTQTVHDLMTPSTPAAAGANRQEIIRLLQERGPLGPHEIWQALADIDGPTPDLQEPNVKMTLIRMRDAGQIKQPSRGIYEAI